MDQSLDEIIKGQGKPEASSGAGRRRQRGGQGRRRGGRGSGSRDGPVAASRGSERDSARAVLIKNLHRDIQEDDLRDLFREVGPVTRVVIEEDNTGIRTGLAWVLYDYSSDASVAAGRYDGRKAAGQIITVRQVPAVGDTRPINRGSLSSRIGPSPSDRSGQRGKKQSSRRGGRDGKSREESKGRPKTAEELDAELDAYMSGGKSSNPVEVSEPAAAEPVAAPAAVDAQPVAEIAAEDVMIE